jgi:membrane protease YdiL (CAAX protease family)
MLGKQEAIMQNSKTSGERAGNSGQIVAWVALLFALTFLCALPLIIGGISLPKLSPSAPLFPISFAGVMLVGYTPMLAALLVAGFFPGAAGVRPLLRQVCTWRVGIGWYGIALIGPIVLFLLADVVHFVLGGTRPQPWLRFPSPSYFGPGGLVFLVGSLLAGSFGEEPGWRGFALPPLQKRYGALAGSILIGLIWSTWHIWIVITPGGFSLMTPVDVVLNTYVRLIATAVIYTWMYNSTGGSLFLVMVAHAGHNIAGTLIQAPADGIRDVSAIVALSYLAVAIGVVLMTGPRTLSRSNRGDGAAFHEANLSGC